MPPRRSAATPALQPIGNAIAAALTREIKLPPFEEDMPHAWYNQAEAYFPLHGVTDRMFWFYYIQWALTPVQKKLARDLLSIPDLPPIAYELLKEQLLRLYDKGEKDRCRRLLSMPPLGSRRLSELLAEMLQLCSRDDVDGRIIRYMFLFCLTPTMQLMLGEDNTSSITELAARADALMDAEAAKEHAVAAAVEEATVAAAGTGPTLSARKRKPDWYKNKKPAPKKSKGDGHRPDPGPWNNLIICWSPYTYGNKAKNCRPPCARAEN
jgi:hypothetical protein